MRLSLSAVTVFASTKLDLVALDRPHETYVFKHLDHDDTYSDILAGHAGLVLINVPTIVDPSLAPPGEHVVMLTIPIPYDVGEPWETARDRIVDEALALCDRAVPELRPELEIHEFGTPLSLERFTGAERGAMFGWEFAPDQVASKRLKAWTPVEGLALAGDWTHPGAGSLRVLASGFLAGQGVLERAGRPTKQLPLAIDSVWRERTTRKSSPGWTRTNNPPVNSRMLCQLSYRGLAADCSQALTRTRGSRCAPPRGAAGARGSDRTRASESCRCRRRSRRRSSICSAVSS